MLFKRFCSTLALHSARKGQLCHGGCHIWFQVSLDAASFEVVTNCWASLLPLLQQGLIDVLLCNEEEALAVAKVRLANSTCNLAMYVQELLV